MKRFLTFAACLTLLGATAARAEYIATVAAERETYDEELDKITFTVDSVNVEGAVVAAIEGAWTATGGEAALYLDATEYWPYYTYVLPPAPPPGGPPAEPHSYCNFYGIATTGVDWLRTGEGTNYSEMLGGAWYTEAPEDRVGEGETLAVFYVTKDAGISYSGEMGVSLYGVGSTTKAYEFSMPPVPEPSTLVLLACGLLGLAAYALRKRK